MHCSFGRLLIFSGFLFSPLFLLAQDEKDDYKVLKTGQADFSVDLEEEKTSITGKKDVLLRDAPATVSVLTEEDILRSGSRDLMDVLRLIPGFEFGTDVQGVACLGIRGNSANEGGLLVLVDGMEMTEILYASNNFGSIYPIDQIKKIEVIRGPGSVLYGGFAVYAVINIVTRSSDTYNGFRVTNTIGETIKGSPRRNTSASFGAMYEKFNYSITTGFSTANRSDGFYSDSAGKEVDLTRNSRLNDRFLSGRFQYGNFSMKGLADLYQIQTQTGQGPVTKFPYTLNFSNLNLEAVYNYRLSSSIVARPYFSLRRQNPWQLITPPDSNDSGLIGLFHAHATRISSGANAEWNINNNLEISGGLGFWRENSHDVVNPDSGINGTFQCLTSFFQGIWKTRLFNLSAGVRLDRHSYYPDQPLISPRIALIKPLGNQYFKFSFNRSLRTPAIANIVFSLNPVINPQTTNYFDLEYGIRIGHHLSLAFNAFHIAVKEGIVYQIINDIGDGYTNSGRQGTQGLEAQFSFRNNHGASIQGSWSFYRNNESEPGGNYYLPGKSINLAYPAHKVCLNAGLPITRKLKLNTTMLFISSRYGFNGLPDNPDFINYGNRIQWNAYLDWRDVYLKGLHLGLGIFDISNSNYSLIQPYRSYLLPIPGLSTEFTFRISYGLNPEGR